MFLLPPEYEDRQVSRCELNSAMVLDYNFEYFDCYDTTTAVLHSLSTWLGVL